MKKLLSVLLACLMLLSLTACNKGNEGGEVVEKSYDEICDELYEVALGEYYDYYLAAQDATSVSERYALQAIAEAKLLESGTCLPVSSKGGLYAISRVVPRTASACLWGNDSEKFCYLLVCNEIITSEDRDYLKSLYAEKAGSGEYAAKAKAYLAGKGYTFKDSYTLGYTSDPKTWDYLNTYRSADSEAICNTTDNLVYVDNENVVQYALATSHEVSEDGLVYTFKLRDDVVWTDSQGREIAGLTAADFVNGLHHLLDAQGGLEYLTGASGAHIVNADDYVAGTITDFAEVGIKAVDDYTLEYTLDAPITYFTTLLGYNPFTPICSSYYESQGGKYGAEFDSAAEDYNYGKTPDNIAYCGPYVVSSITAENSIVFEANPAYWNAENVTLKKIVWLYAGNYDDTQAYTNVKDGTMDGCSLNTTSLELAKKDGLFDKYSYVSLTDATSYSIWFNLNRQAYANINDATHCVSLLTDDQKKLENAAMNDVHFRMAIAYSLDRLSYNAQTTGDAVAQFSLINSYVPGNFVSLPEDVTVDINGTATTFTAGTFYGAILQAQLDADGCAVKAWDAEAEGGLGASSGYDGWYNPEAAAAELAIAIENLKAKGFEVSEENPIVIEMVAWTGRESYYNRAQALKQSVEKNTNGLVKMNLLETADVNDWYYAGYYADYGYECNYDIYDVSGWGPDYGDPQTYLATLLPQTGDMISVLGLY